LIFKNRRNPNFDGKEISDSLGDENLMVCQYTDLVFHSFFETLISLCCKGTADEQIPYASALDIFLDLLAKNPSAQNFKLIQVEIPSIMLTIAVPTQAIRPFLLSYSQEDRNDNAEFF